MRTILALIASCCLHCCVLAQEWNATLYAISFGDQTGPGCTRLVSFQILVDYTGGCEGGGNGGIANGSLRIATDPTSPGTYYSPNNQNGSNWLFCPGVGTLLIGYNHSYAVNLIPGAYTLRFVYGPDITQEFSIEVPDQLSATMTHTIIDQQMPSSICASDGRLDVGYAITPQPTCYTTPTAVFYADGTEIAGVWMGSFFRFNNIPNCASANWEITTTNGTLSTGHTYLEGFHAPCPGGEPATEAAQLCSPGRIHGTVPDLGCAVAVAVVAVEGGISATVQWDGPDWWAEVGTGLYAVAIGAGSVCLEEYVVEVVMEDGETAASVTINTEPSGTGCPNGVATVNIQPNGPCVAAVILVGVLEGGVYQSWGTFNYEGPGPLSYTAHDLPAGEHFVTVILSSGAGLSANANHAFSVGDTGPISAEQQYVKDEDGDNRYTEGPQYHCAPPEGWVLFADTLIAGDCAPQDPQYYEEQNWVRDEDRDGHWIESEISWCGPPSELHVLLVPGMFNGDCDDTVAPYYQVLPYVMDADLDGHYTGEIRDSVCIPNAGEVRYEPAWHIPGDCDDSNPTAWEERDHVRDADMDGHYIGTSVPMCSAQEGFRPLTEDLLAGDCNDDPAMNGQLVFQDTTFVRDADQDNHYVEGSELFGCIPLTGYVVLVSTMTEGDCDDDDAAVQGPVGYVLDADGDGFFSEGPEHYCMTEAPNSWVVQNGQQGGDCNDDPSSPNATLQHPGRSGTYSGIDNDCDGIVSVLNNEVAVLDFNNDGTMDHLDHEALQSRFGCIVVQVPDCSLYDLDEDGVVGQSDVQQFNAVYHGN